MKKLLLLGGSRYLLPVIKVAHELGLYVITCDYLPNNIAHRYSDEYINVSIVNKHEVLAVARSEHIAGIMSFATDPGVETAAYVAEQLKLPSCGPYESVRILQNKDLFRKFLKDNNFNVPSARSYSTYEEAKNEIDLFTMPVIVKPTDSAGSKGVSKVNTLEQLKSSVDFAKKYSRSGLFIIEDFIEKKGCSSDSDSFSVDGNLKVCSFSSQRFDDNANNPYTPAAYSWPSTFSLETEKYLRSELQRLLSLLHMRTSIYNIETRESTDGKAYIMEVSPRGGGNRLAEMLKHATGIDLIKNAVKAAIGMPLDNLDENIKLNGAWAEVILHAEKDGIYRKVEIAPEIKCNIVEIDVWVTNGAKVNKFTGANDTIGTIVLRFDSQLELDTFMQNISANIRVVVE